MEAKKIDWRAILLQILLSLISGGLAGAGGGVAVAPPSQPAPPAALAK